MHSQSVAILAENAAKNIGADPVRVRAVALYHDIGKLNNPEYFTENNINTGNLHTHLHPQLSSVVLRGHVKDGLDLAHRHKLCRLIRDGIEQHHGTGLMQFFYRKAVAESHGQPVDESQYRYPGPLPRDPEIAIVGLADACEAACRSLDKPSAGKIAAKVNEIFGERMLSGQLDRAELSLADLALIRESFIRTLTTMYHGRIAYPKGETQSNENALPLATPVVAQTGAENAPADSTQSGGAGRVAGI